MAAAAQVTSIRWDADRLAAFAPAVAASPFPLEDSMDVLRGAFLYDYALGQQHALIAVRPVQCAAGLRLDLVGLRSDGQRFQAAALDDALTRIAYNHRADALAMTTMHPHLVRACERTGWRNTGAVVTKVLKIQ